MELSQVQTIAGQIMTSPGTIGVRICKSATRGYYLRIEVADESPKKRLRTNYGSAVLPVVMVTTHVVEARQPEERLFLSELIQTMKQDGSINSSIVERLIAAHPHFSEVAAVAQQLMRALHPGLTENPLGV